MSTIIRRQFLASTSLVLLSGCSAWDVLTVRSQSPDRPEAEESPSTRLVGDFAVPFGMFPVRVEGVTLVSGLSGTGSDPAPSPQRAYLLSEIQTRGVKKPNALMASPNTAMVLVQGVLPPGIQKGDRFDVEVRVHSRSETTSLRGGHMLEVRLREMAVLGGEFHEGKLLALAEGPVMVDPSPNEKEDRVLAGRGRVLGGGVARKSRQLGLVLKPDHQNVFIASRLANAVNKRFHTFDKGIKIGVAKGKTDKFVELIVHPRYKDNIPRYVRVVRAVAIRETAVERMERIAGLKDRLLDPVTAAAAALQLEAIGNDGIDTLKQGILSSNPEVRFYAAEALAYLDCPDAAKPLGEAARKQPAFRVFALTALSAMREYAAYEQLRDLLAVPSAETRYGAFRALWAMNPGDPLVLGERLGNQFSYHVLNTAGPPMIHVTRNRRPEVVLFGEGQRLLTPLAVNASNQIMITSTGPDRISVARFAANKPDLKRVVSPEVDEVIRAIVEVGGTYPDVVQALQEAKAARTLTSRFEVDALPQAGRSYVRDIEEEEKTSEPRDGDLARSGASSEPPVQSGDGDPPTRTGSGDPCRSRPPDSSQSVKSKRNPNRFSSFLAKMMGRG